MATLQDEEGHGPGDGCDSELLERAPLAHPARRAGAGAARTLPPAVKRAGTLGLLCLFLAAVVSAIASRRHRGPEASAQAPELVSLQESAKGSCKSFQQKSKNCDNNCGMCFNPGARPGAMCKGEAPGYHCPSDNPPPGSMMAFACMDWTFGSTAMLAAEASYNGRSGEPVYFGVGTYGTMEDEQRGLGLCVLMHVDGVDRPILAQSINTGSDVSGNQFDLQIGAGGAGAFNTCAGGSAETSMYGGSTGPWGHQYGGNDHRAECAGLPPYPQQDAPMKAAGDNLVKLCEYGFDKGVRGEEGTPSWKALGNPSILSIGRVACPPELVNLTQLHRSDDPPESSPAPPAKAAHECQARPGGGSLDWCLTRMMDCRMPSGGFRDNIKDNLVAAGHKLVQPCTADGYTRIDVQCGCWDCYC